MRYVNARLDDYNRDMAYRIYITKSLQLAPQNMWLTKDFTDFLDPKPEEDEEINGDEIVISIMKRAGLTIGD